MLDQIWIIIGIVIGGALSFLGGWSQTSRNRKWFLEDLKRERKFAAIEIRLKQAEESADFMNNHVFNAWLISEATTRVRTPADLNELKEKHKIFEDKFIYSDKTPMSTMVRIASLVEKNLDNAWQNMVDSSGEVIQIKNTLYIRVAQNMDFLSDPEANNFQIQIEDLRTEFALAGKEFYKEINLLRERIE